MQDNLSQKSLGLVKSLLSEYEYDCEDIGIKHSWELMHGQDSDYKWCCNCHKEDRE